MGNLPQATKQVNQNTNMNSIEQKQKWDSISLPYGLLMKTFKYKIEAA
jgi:hypothetical protein